MDTSKPHIAAAAGLGALLPFIPDLVKLIPALPMAVSNALCAVVVAMAYALVPAKKPGPASERGSARATLVQVLGLGVLFAVVSCAVLQNAKKDPGAATREVLKAAELACLGCQVPGLPKEAHDACVKLEPVCKGLAGVCEDRTEE